MDVSQQDRLKELTKRKTELENALRALRAKYIDDANEIQRQATKIDDAITALRHGVKS